MRNLYSRKAVLYDVANLAYVVGDVREGEYTAHSLHHTFDICAPGNIDRVNRVLNLAIAEVEAIVNPPHGISGRGMEKLLRNLVHEYLVARVLYDWLTVAFPPGLSANGTRLSANVSGSSSKAAADNVISIWKERTSEARKALETAVRNGSTKILTRRVPPI
ncbi:MAG: hypothetical protein K2L34_01900 [Muribaculaceae bacterium]|nr:hypothetical protein [Muribaculaceae bacterium]